MELDRGALAKIDRRILSGLDHNERYWMVRVPVSEALWSTWRRYCRALGVAMGRGRWGAGLQGLSSTGSALSKVRPRLVESCSPVSYSSALWHVAEDLDVRERRLDERERSLRSSERRLRARATPFASSARGKVGRNEPCPCGSGFKYKRCHGT
jgi:hypothetical protein